MAGGGGEVGGRVRLANYNINITLTHTPTTCMLKHTRTHTCIGETLK